MEAFGETLTNHKFARWPLVRFVAALQDVEGAIKYCRRATEVDPLCETAHVHMAHLQLQMSNLKVVWRRAATSPRALRVAVVCSHSRTCCAMSSTRGCGRRIKRSVHASIGSVRRADGARHWSQPAMRLAAMQHAAPVCFLAELFAFVPRPRFVFVEVVEPLNFVNRGVSGSGRVIRQSGCAAADEAGAACSREAVSESIGTKWPVPALSRSYLPSSLLRHCQPLPPGQTSVVAATIGAREVTLLRRTFMSPANHRPE
eukprot:6180543-Pleurochrysis_carterae.AAC.1